MKLNDHDIKNTPLETFQACFDEALEISEHASAMTLATVGADSRPSSRTVLFKGLLDGAFSFYTNYESRKGEELKRNPYCSLTFYWPLTKKQVTIRGSVEKLSKKKSRDYFYGREKDSQIASAISNQSQELKNDEEMLELFKRKKAEYESQEVPFPENWGGYKVNPFEIEFFLYGPNRLNIRYQYTMHKGAWSLKRLWP